MTAKTWDELYGEGAKDNTPNTLAFAITDVEEDKLVGYTPEQLTTLVRRLLCELGTASLMTKEETAQAMLDTLANTALRPIVAGLNMKADIQARMAAIDKWLDRERGKPAQYIEQRSLVATIALDERKIEARKEAENLLIMLAKSDSS